MSITANRCWRNTPAMCLGVFGFLTKPVWLPQFVASVTAAVARHRLREAAGILGYGIDAYKQLQVGALYVDAADRNRLTKQLAKAGEHRFEYPLRHRVGHTVWVRAVLPLSGKRAAPASKQRALIVSTSDRVFQALEIFLTEGPGIHAQTIDTLKELDDRVWATPWDLIVLDTALTGAESGDVVRRIREAAPRSGVIAMVEGRSMARVRELTEARALGCMTTHCSEDAWRQAFKAVLARTPYMAPILASDSTSDGEAPHQKLPAREFEILCSIGEGKTVKQIAEEIDRSEITVRQTRLSLRKKMNMRTDSELTRYAVDWNLID